MHALVDQLAAAGARRVGAPLAVVARPAAVAVAGAHVQDLAVLARARLAHRARDRGMEAVVEADVDVAVRAFRRGGDRAHLRRPDPGRLLHEHVLARLQRRDRQLGQRVVRGGHDHGVGGVEHGLHAVDGGFERRHGVVARHQLVGAQHRRPLAPDQAAADDADLQPALLADRALEVELEAQLLHAGRAHRLARVVGPRGVDEQEAATAGADQLPADHAGTPRERVEPVDVLVRHPRRALALVLPVLVHQLGEALQIAGLEQRAALEAHRLRPVQVLEHRVVLLVRAAVLVGQQRARAARLAGVEEQEVARHPAQRLRVELERLDGDGVVGIERVRAHAAVRGDVLVLLADRLLEHVDLDLARRLGQLARRQRRVARERERLQQAHRVGAGRAHPGAGGHVGHRRDLERLAAPVPDQHLAQDRVADLARVVDLLELRVLEPVAALEHGVREHVDVLVDRPADEEAAVLAVVGRQVGAAAAERDAQRRAAKDHGHRATPGS